MSVVNFRIASSRRFKDSAGVWKEEVCYVGVVAWQKLAETCEEFLAKGSAVFVDGGFTELGRVLKHTGTQTSGRKNSAE